MWRKSSSALDVNGENGRVTQMLSYYRLRSLIGTSIWKTRMDEQEAIWKGRMKDLRDDMQSLLREIATLRQQLAEATKVAPPPPLGLVFIYWKRNSLLER